MLDSQSGVLNRQLRNLKNDDYELVCDFDTFFLRISLMFEMHLTFYLYLI